MLCRHCPRTNSSLPRENVGLLKVQVPVAAKRRTKSHGREVPALQWMGLEASISYGIKVREMYADRSHPISNCITLATHHLQIRAEGRVPLPLDTSILDHPIACPALSHIRPPAAVLPRKRGAGVIVKVNLWAVYPLLLVRLHLMRLY